MTGDVVVLDGGMGRELWRMGAPFRQPEWSALALTEGPDLVVQAHRNFIDAGAEVITTNSYAIVPFHIGETRFATQAAELAATAGRLARRAAAQADRAVRVAGSLPPLFGSYRPDLFDADRAASIIDPMVDGLADHVDVWLGETLGSIAEAEAVRQAIDRIGSPLPLWISFTLDDVHDGTVRSGEPVVDAVMAALDLGASAVLFNCSQSEVIAAAIDLSFGTVPGDVAVGGYANRFVATHAASGGANEELSPFRDDLGPHAYGEVVAGWIEHGARIVGGCCGMGPEHIAEIAEIAAAANARRKVVP